MYKLLSIILLCLSVLSMNTAHANAQPKPDIPDGEVGDWRKTPGALRPAPDKIIPFPKPAKPQKVHVPFDVKKIGKYLGKGGAALLPALAYELIGAGVDYALDPDNNRVVITPDYANCFTGSYRGSLLTVHRLECARPNREISGTPKQYNQSRDGTYHTAYCAGGSDMAIVCNAQPKTEVPLDELVDRIIDAARRGNPDAIRALESWADNEVNTNPDAYRRQLESSDPNVNPNIDPNSETNPEENPSAEVCQTGYSKDKDGVCVPEKQEAAEEDEDEDEQSSEEDSKQEDEEQTDGTLDIDSTPIPLNKVNISFGGVCPLDSTFPFSIAGRRFSFSMSYHYICKIAVSVGGIVKILSTIVAMYILAGIKS